jgi:ubiquinone/menaquinone biosynthesis C-methylase UbiE
MLNLQINQNCPEIMKHQECLTLISGGLTATRGMWADLGSGNGAFTFALCNLLGKYGEIYSVDNDSHALKRQEKNSQKNFSNCQINFIHADFRQEIHLPPLDGVLMANALHFVQDKKRVIQMIKTMLKPTGRFILIEYNVKRKNPWVPYPIRFEEWVTLAAKCGFLHTKLLATIPSRYHHQMYSALSW